MTERRVVGRLAAPAPGWSVRADVVVIGSGIAGLTAALRLRGLVDKVLWSPRTSSTPARPSGPRAASPPRSARATPRPSTSATPSWPGAGACDAEAVRVLVTEGPEAVRELIALGANFDLHPDGELSLTREGGHHRDRIAHAGGDATGAEIQRALIAAVARAPEIEVVEHALAVDLQLAARRWRRRASRST